MSKPASPRKVGEKEALAVGTTIRGSAQKLNLVAALIRNRKVGDALNILTFSKRAMAQDVKKVLASAVANAENNHNLDVDALVVAEASVGKSISMKRFATRARGRSSRIVKPFSRLDADLVLINARPRSVIDLGFVDPVGTHLRRIGSEPWFSPHVPLSKVGSVVAGGFQEAGQHRCLGIEPIRHRSRLLRAEGLRVEDVVDAIA